ncbi:hypothetical protein EX895_003332 [Sporisorium graminicola]|uniref:CLASP N-terminal domain-containing protein n=1 Tax=Sporisorium graminicola TaxID=280036 RepID=A0A4U7KTB2_9BASI|nr:hypothetical protein EX895_003332 [Sporisorium graminicola]TKY87751.1 hypothetical protein EX895_003332 [Sporisorium graminicola]
MPSRTLAPDAKINIASASDLHSHFDELYDDLYAPETEHTWQKIERALVHIQAITRGGATKHAEFVALLKEAAAPISNALLSERTKLSGTAGDLLNSIAPRMAERFEPLVSVFVPTLLLICARTNKVAVKRAEKSLHFIVKHCRPPSMVTYLKEAIKDKGQGLRAVAAATLEMVLEHTEKERLARRVGDIESCIKSGATDSNPEVRQTTKRLFELYVAFWPERVEHFTKPMTPTIRRYLSLPKTGALIVDVPPMTEVSTKPTHSSRPPPAPQHTLHSSRQDDLLMPASHAPPSRSAPTPAYNFFPDLHKSTAALNSSTARMPVAAGGFGMNDASYGKRGLLAEQIAAARNARLARIPSFNFDELPKSNENGPTMKRQPSFDQLRAQSAAPTATFRVPRFDVVVAPTSSDGRSRSAHASDPAQYRDINAVTPSFAAASGLHGKSALLAAYKQAFAVESGVKSGASSSSRERLHWEHSDKQSKHHDKRREKTVAVRFDSDSKHENPVQHTEGNLDELRRSKSAPQIHVDKVQRPAEVDSNSKASKAGRSEAADWADSDDDDDEANRPSTPPERVLHAQTPRTGVKASRVPAQRVVMHSEVKVSAMRVAVPTPSAKVAAGRVVSSTLSAESSPVARSRVAKVDPATQEEEAKESPVRTETKEVAGVNAKLTDEKVKEVEEEKKEVAAAKTKEDVKDKPSALGKKPTTSTMVGSSKQPVKSATTKTAPSASIAAKARLEARVAVRPATATAAAATAADSKKVVPRPVSSVAKPTMVRKPVTSLTVAAGPASKPAAAAASSAKPTKAPSTVKPNSATSTATARAKAATANKVAAPTTASSAAKRQEPATVVARTSTLMAPTASTRNKIVPAAAVKKFQPKLSSTISNPRSKSSIAASLAAKSKVLGAPAASDKASAVRKAAGATVVARMKVGRRGSTAAGAGHIIGKEVRVAVIEKEAVAEETVAQNSGAAPEAEGEGESSTGQGSVVTDNDVSGEDKVVANEKVVIFESGPTTEPLAVVEAATEQDIISISPDSTTYEAEMDAEVEQQQIAADEDSRSTEPVAISTPSAVATPVRKPVAGATATPPAQIRTPLTSKDTNVPRAATPLTGGRTNKITPSPPPTSQTKSKPARSFPGSPLRRTTPSPSKALLPRFVADASSSFEESDSEEEEEEEEDTEQVVQLHFRSRPVATQLPPAQQVVVKGHKVVSAGPNKQLVLGLDSSDDSGVVEAGEGDETVLLEHAV